MIFELYIGNLQLLVWPRGSISIIGHVDVFTFFLPRQQWKIFRGINKELFNFDIAFFLKLIICIGQRIFISKYVWPTRPRPNGWSLFSRKVSVRHKNKYSLRRKPCMKIMTTYWMVAWWVTLSLPTFISLFHVSVDAGYFQFRIIPLNWFFTPHSYVRNKKQIRLANIVTHRAGLMKHFANWFVSPSVLSVAAYFCFPDRQTYGHQAWK